MNQTLLIKDIEKSCADVCRILKSLSHPRLLLILGHLIHGSKTVTELVKLCNISQSQMSQFLIRMKFEGLLDSEKLGKHQSYSVADKRLIKLIKVIQNEYCK